MSARGIAKFFAASPPSPAIAVRSAVLQNALEQAVFAFGAHLALAAVLRGPQLVLLPPLVALFLVGRVAFAAGYRKGAPRLRYGGDGRADRCRVPPRAGSDARALSLAG